MVKTKAIHYINSQKGSDNLKTKNTTFASISISGNRAAWWMNIKLENFKKDWNIVLVGAHELIWLKIPANTFINLEKHFRIWEAKNAVNLVISSDPQDRYLHDLSSGGSDVDFKSFIVEKFPISEELKSNSKKSVLKPSHLKKEYTSSTSVPELKTKSQEQEIIKQDQTNITFEKLFASHLKEANNIILQDPWIRLPYQFNNLLEFCVMLGNLNNPGKIINLKVISWNLKEFLNQSKDCFEEIAANVKEMGINLTYSLEKHHDRYIETNNRCKIILGRGLDIFEKREGRFSIGDVDQRWRKCKPCEITYITRNF
ncbi:hypothetical protein LB465_11405 [Salegentibacter sp. LM13S]|uniref:MIT C-terminal domain-containing protein n=1 Tax=Salegentibacter lacus TaxID=2873599 RepID=UPI001CCF2A75|nr:MIT C-terminal domain-containing protein [Salegentibacter lacus]MBZ9631387.1 hypothetical protein [Salegentibacter lacus]